ncbi:patatin-like phospholipase family protein [Neobacillus niacini]|uniref:patatin-like phospholipase family protein n=1 Tax=Neobacillus niacini TaxID=86668 RepID=UPI001C8DBF60|nr:patatin-like phospholipase family protein [Neobacillus niacini]MBY0148846.1 patatin-like phospholipase family protein [Neobacillus niacini]
MVKYTLCLSGGGFRASLFHAGLVRRLIYLDLFKHIHRINSISGGSITAGLIMKELTVKSFSDVDDFDQRVIVPLIKFIQSSPRKKIYKINPLNNNPHKFSKYVDQQLFNGLAFSDLCKFPAWHCYATSLNSAMSWKFSQTEIGDSATGFSQPSHIDKVADGIVASACFPPLFKPFKFNTEGRSFVLKWVNGQLLNVPNSSPPSSIFLTDGGVYDNLGSESVITKKADFIVSDASGVVDHWGNTKPNKFFMMKRTIDVSMDQNGKLRRRLLFNSLNANSVLVELAKPLDTYTKKVVPDKDSPTPPEQMPIYPEIHRDFQKAIGTIRTDLNAFHDFEIHTLIWNGMVKIDAAMKRWCPHLIKEQHWNDVPNLNSIDFPTAAEVLNKGSKTNIWGKQHQELHSEKKLVDNISNIL